MCVTRRASGVSRCSASFTKTDGCSGSRSVAAVEVARVGPCACSDVEVGAGGVERDVALVGDMHVENHAHRRYTGRSCEKSNRLTFGLEPGVGAGPYAGNADLEWPVPVEHAAAVVGLRRDTGVGPRTRRPSSSTPLSWCPGVCGLGAGSRLPPGKTHDCAVAVHPHRLSSHFGLPAGCLAGSGHVPPGGSVDGELVNPPQPRSAAMVPACPSLVAGGAASPPAEVPGHVGDDDAGLAEQGELEQQRALAVE